MPHELRSQPRAPRSRRRVAVPMVAAALVVGIGVPTAVGTDVAASLWQVLKRAERNASAPEPTAKPSPDIGSLVVPTATPEPSLPKYPFTEASVWRTSVRDAPLDPDSAAMVAHLDSTVKDRYGGVAAFNVWDFNTTYYVADAATPRVDVLFDDCQGKGYTPAGLTGPGGQFTQVPVPVGAVAAAGSDASYSVFSPATDQLWEMWLFRKNAAGRWTACWGGRMDNVTKSNGAFSGNFGSTASGLAMTGGMITLDDAKSLDIRHALDLAVPDVRAWPAKRWPAQRTDGNSTNPASLPEGTRLRLDPTVDVAALKLHPIAEAVARAAQEYGFIVTDKSGAVSVRAESGLPAQRETGVDPWKAILGPTPNYKVMAGFPWNRLQVVAETKTK